MFAGGGIFSKENCNRYLSGVFALVAWILKRGVCLWAGFLFLFFKKILFIY